MGYDYYILIQGKKEGRWVKIEYQHKSGTYGAVDNHYFYTHKDMAENYYGDGSEFSHNMGLQPGATAWPMGDYQYIFSYDQIKKDYLEYCQEIPIDDVKEHLTEVSANEITLSVLRELRDYLDSVISNNGESEGMVAELKEYYHKCSDALVNYDTVRVVFGLTP